MTSNQQKLQTNQFNIENLKDLALSYVPPSWEGFPAQDRELKRNESELVSSRFESLSKRFCQCDLLHIDQSSKSTWTELSQNNALFDQRCRNQAMQNYYEWNVNNWNERYANQNIIFHYIKSSRSIVNREPCRYITPYGDFMPGTLGDCQMYNTNVQGFFGQHWFTTPQSARNGFMSAQFNESSDNLELIRSRKKRNKMSLTMKKIVSNNPCLSGMDDEFKLSNSSNTNGQDENISSFACRADVIYKKIFRDFRRYFINDFKEKTGYRESKSESLASNA